MATKFQYSKVKESSIPLNVLYNDTINKLKGDERRDNREPKALAFCLRNMDKGKSIRFEILGENT